MCICIVAVCVVWGGVECAEIAVCVVCGLSALYWSEYMHGMGRLREFGNAMD